MAANLVHHYAFQFLPITVWPRIAWVRAANSSTGFNRVEYEVEVEIEVEVEDEVEGEVKGHWK